MLQTCTRALGFVTISDLPIQGFLEGRGTSQVVSKSVVSTLKEIGVMMLTTE